MWSLRRDEAETAFQADVDWTVAPIVGQKQRTEGSPRPLRSNVVRATLIEEIMMPAIQEPCFGSLVTHRPEPGRLPRPGETCRAMALSALAHASSSEWPAHRPSGPRSDIEQAPLTVI